MNPADPSIPQQPADMNAQPAGDGQISMPNPGQAQASVQPPIQAPAPLNPASQMMPQSGTPTPPAANIAVAQVQQNAQASVPNDVATTTKNPTAKIIEDKDLIEKEWVEKAKKIVDANSGDPYKQAEALTAFRAEYMQKEYNKTIKTDT